MEQGASGTDVQTLYAAAGQFDPTHDPALLLADMDEDKDIAYPDPTAPKIANLGVPGSLARLAHFGEYTMVGWYRQTETTTFALARGLTDAQLVRAARAAVIGDRAPRVPSAALPAGFERIAGAKVLPSQGGSGVQSISLTSADGHHEIRMRASDLDRGDRVIERFLGDFPGSHAGTASSARMFGAREMFVRGDASPEVLAALTRSVEPVDAAGWSAFQRRMLALPTSFLMLQCPKPHDAVVISGIRHDVRWAVALPASPRSASWPCVGVVRIEPGSFDNIDSFGVGDPSVKDRAEITSVGGVTRLVGDNWSNGRRHTITVGGMVPPGTARVAVQAGGQAGDARLADGPAGARRYYGAYLDRLSIRLPEATVTAYGTDGRELGHWHRPAHIS
jgi:hypothetical protein